MGTKSVGGVFGINLKNTITVPSNSRRSEKEHFADFRLIIENISALNFTLL